MDRVKRIWYLSPMRAAKVQASLRIRAVSPEPSLLAHTSSESRGTFRQKTRSIAPLNGWACAVEICHDGMLEDTNSLGGAQIKQTLKQEKIKVIPSSDVTNQSIKWTCLFLFLFIRKLEQVFKSPDFKYMDYFIKRFNVAFKDWNHYFEVSDHCLVPDHCLSFYFSLSDEKH